jgi:hypothetical protein
MNLKNRIQRLESRPVETNPLTEEERTRLKQLSEMDPDNPDYEVLEHLELHYKANPGLTFEQYLREAMDEW